MPLKNSKLAICGYVPEMDGFVATTARQALTVWMPCDHKHIVRVRQLRQQSSGRRLKYQHVLLFKAAKFLAVRAESDAGQRKGPIELLVIQARSRIEKVPRIVPMPDNQGTAVRRKANQPGIGRKFNGQECSEAQVPNPGVSLLVARGKEVIIGAEHHGIDWRTQTGQFR